MRRDVIDSGGGRRPQGRAPLLAALVLLAALTPVGVHAQGTPPDSVALVWTAPGDDGQTGTASAFELRSSTNPINESNWVSATIVPGTPVPLAPGGRQRMVVRGLTYGTTYYFTIKTVDNAGNWSDLSNLLKWDWLGDKSAPSAPSGVRGRRGGGRPSLSWEPNSEPDLAGYSVYRALSDGGAFNRISAGLVTAPEYEDATVPVGTETAWYQVTATDDAGNESPPSSTFMLSLVAEVTAWAMEPGYPNPSSTGAIVRIPLVVPTAGGNARIEIVNSAGQRVRLLDLGTLVAGTPVMQWDGRNERGRDVAAGVYTAWLITGSTRLAIRLLRVP